MKNHLETSLGALIGQAGRAMARALMDKFNRKGYEFGMDHWIVLVHLWKEDGQTQQNLGETAGKNKTSVTRAIDWLEKNNYVVRVADREDRRHKRIYLTNSGKNMQELLAPEVKEVIAEATAGIPPEEVEACKNVLRHMFSNLKSYI
ncbi:MAG: MarR family winged helix-turn-helix transcriptional regulator [Bacteroidota bacterium]